MSETPRISDMHARIKQAVADDLRASQWSREEIAERLSNATGARITVAQLDAIASATKPHRLPAEWIPAWVSVTKSTQILELLCERCGMHLATTEDKIFAEYGRTVLKSDELRSRLGGTR